jgi:3-oxoacyl-[acyl-carrier-protein] synthase II
MAYVVGSEALLTPTGLASFGWLEALNKHDEPTNQFSMERRGFDMGEGAAGFVFETLDHAIKRGGEDEIWGVLLGFGASCDAHKETAPHPDGRGMLSSMEKALRDADLCPWNIDYVNAHGTGTWHNDRVETLAIKNLFGPMEVPPVSSTKSQAGHLIGASGAIELLACLLAIKNRMLPPTVTYKTRDPACDLDYVPHAARKAEKLDVVLKNSFAFGGSNASLVIGRYDPGVYLT